MSKEILDNIQVWLMYVVSSLVHSPEDIKLDAKIDEMGILFTISSPNKKVLGILIGENGSHVNALRTILRTHGHLKGVKASLKVITE